MQFAQSAYDPETLTLLRRAYADALDELKPSMKRPNDPRMDAVRTTLAHRIMWLAARGERDVPTLKRYALRGIDAFLAGERPAH